MSRHSVLLEMPLFALWPRRMQLMCTQRHSASSVCPDAVFHFSHMLMLVYRAAVAPPARSTFRCMCHQSLHTTLEGRLSETTEACIAGVAAPKSASQWQRKRWRIARDVALGLVPLPSLE